ncbi:CRISPR-associated helicase Cas3' [Cohnella sp. 56]|uniref:CRISPR-associated helicase Cas3' n=1 Tax=Cohnella sp. 56 TaxID=3113722 RepID=UPI0030E753F2
MKYAHSKRDPVTGSLLPKQQWHPLESHQQKTSKVAGEYAKCFNWEILGQILGLLHDYGKNLPEFQRRLEDRKIKADHKTAGALAVYNRYPFPYGLILAYAIYGHHGGLPNHISRSGKPGLDDILHKNKFTIVDGVPPEFLEFSSEDIPKPSRSSNIGMSRSLWIRMLYSALVDADYLDTERFLQPERAGSRQAFISLEQIHSLYQAKLNELQASPSNSKIAEARKLVLESCLRAAVGPKGFYTLTAPTGSGKTYASLAFALKHARCHEGTKRIIVALPFTSLIEQTVDVYRKALGSDRAHTVLEHHSNMEFGMESEGEFDPRQLASENWDADLIVTTNVQLFESLFASKPNRARKLHRLAGSVIILDEAQALPEELLLPTLAVLRCLCTDFGVTVLFCTATQPALRSEWLDGLKPVEIMDNPSDLYSSLKRVSVSFIGKKTNVELIETICSQGPQVLCIVNSRRLAQELYHLVSMRVGEGITHHLSALMCAEHRTKVLNKIKDRPKDTPCYVIATTLVEAGVDIDFPVVMREMTGLEGLVQAAGRCNREGYQNEGRMLLFESEDCPARLAWYSGRADLAKLVLRRHPDPLTPEAVKEYFEHFYNMGTAGKLDKYKLLRNLNGAADEYSFQFREIAEQYRFIRDDTIPVVIPYDGTCRNRLQEALTSHYPASYIRKLQRYTVSLYPEEFDQLRRSGRLGNIGDAIYYLQSSEGGIHGKINDWYDADKTGLRSQPRGEE